MIELDYFGSFKAALFKGDLVEVHNAGGIKSERGVPSNAFFLHVNHLQNIYVFLLLKRLASVYVVAQNKEE